MVKIMVETPRIATINPMGIVTTPTVKIPVNIIHSAAKLLKGGKPESIIAPMIQSSAVMGI